MEAGEKPAFLFPILSRIGKLFRLIGNQKSFSNKVKELQKNEIQSFLK